MHIYFNKIEGAYVSMLQQVGKSHLSIIKEGRVRSALVNAFLRHVLRQFQEHTTGIACLIFVCMGTGFCLIGNAKWHKNS